MLAFLAMKHKTEKIQDLRAKAEASLNKTTQQLQQALAQIEAALLRKENQKLKEKSNNK